MNIKNKNNEEFGGGGGGGGGYYWGTITKLQFEDTQLIAKALSFAAGYISGLPEWKDKHPEEVLDWLLEEAKKL